MRQAAAGSNPHGAVTILQKPVAIAIVPDQHVTRRVPTPRLSVKNLNPMVLAKPDPAPAIHPREHHLARREMPHGKASERSVLHLETGGPIARADNPHPPRFVDRQILQMMAELRCRDVHTRPIWGVEAEERVV